MSEISRSLRCSTIMALVAGMACAAGAQTPHASETPETHADVKPAAWQGTEPTVKDDLFAGTEKFAKNASDVTEVTMDPDTLDMVNGNGAKRAHNMVLNVVRTYSYDKPGMYRMEDVEEFRRKLNTGDWHCSVHTRDLKNGESTDICNRRRTDGLVESAIITVEPKELTFIHTIRKKGDQESSLGSEDVWQLGLPNGLPPAAMIAMMRPDLSAQGNAEMQAAKAELQAQGAQLVKLQAIEMPELQGQ
ncbi:MAG: hypothetical protein ACRYFU_19615 [Janthinobacterium lividum]